jgi:hypothetical protein
MKGAWGALVHGVLLLAMLGFAYKSWTRDTTTKATTGSVVVWNEKPSDLASMVFETPERTIKLEKKDGYWWGTDTQIKKSKKLKEQQPPATDAGPAKPEYEETSTTVVTEFPVDAAAVMPLVGGYAAMRALRNLGPLDDTQKDEYKLKDSEKTVSLIFGGGTHTLLLGDKVKDGSDRYMLDVDTGTGYLVAALLITPLEGGQRALQPKQIMPTGEDVQAITIATPDGKSKTVSRITVKDENDKPVKTWGDKAAGKADQTTANFLTKVETNLKASKYDAKLDVKALTKLVTLTYADAQGKSLGTVELYKRTTDAPAPPPPAVDGGAAPPAPPPTVEYFVVSELTRVPAQVSKTAGDQVEQNISTVFAQ